MIYVGHDAKLGSYTLYDRIQLHPGGYSLRPGPKSDQPYPYR